MSGQLFPQPSRFRSMGLGPVMRTCTQEPKEYQPYPHDEGMGRDGSHLDYLSLSEKWEAGPLLHSECLTVGSDLGRMGRAGASNLTGLQFQRAEVPGPQSQNFLAEQRIKFSILHSVHGRRELRNHLRIPALNTRPNSYVHCMTVE